ncbi:zf-HC2 domain-containing protein [Lysinibacillus sp. NPDC048646]|uniref:zf-HC2 domain-containing protein n=1 Tax=Lysinibacillus sp. NPDC048646 TaxID=3390574 RepID=UPI003D00BF79
MKDIKCTIIQDLLPLYVDEVVSDDTKEIVEAHFQQCENCKKDFEAMKQVVYIPVEKEVSTIKSIQRKWRSKKLIISGTSIVLTAALLFGAFHFIFHYDSVIPYKEDLIKVETQQDKLVSHYYALSYYALNATHPIELNINGEEKNVSFIQYTKTMANSPTREHFKNNSVRNEQQFISEFPESEEIDAIYYVNGDMDGLTPDRSTWQALLEDAVLIWEK